MKISRSVATTASPDAVYAYLSDFTTTNEWDPGTVETTRASGDGGVGTTYDNVSEFNGRRTELTYEVVDLDPGRRIELHGEGKSATAVDVMEIEPTEHGCRVTYTADIRLKGVLRLAEPFIRGAFTKLGDEAEVGLRDALEKL
ncbi:SRPBCC family protein [Nocardioides panacisoli]|uniref:SRPBCC family protein n=1 Tax=Nocardioides panacisoli TaxID=627624 RepID=UPI001C631679|nr:SRPBCC family protein [Nocardioides panacisoli]QYJ03337.1 SRPBCC family protein [Nocardioides panacisoli]